MILLTHQAEKWYQRASVFWPTHSSSSTSNSIALPSSYGNLLAFVERYPPLSAEQLSQLSLYAEKIPDMQHRTRSRLLSHRCKEMSKIIRARQTHLVEFHPKHEFDSGACSNTTGTKIKQRYGNSHQPSLLFHSLPFSFLCFPAFPFAPSSFLFLAFPLPYPFLPFPFLLSFVLCRSQSFLPLPFSFPFFLFRGGVGEVAL